MKFETAICETVHDFGVKELASELDLAPSTLYGMANPNIESHNWSLNNWRKTLQKTGDMRSLEAICQENNGVYLPTKFENKLDQGLADEMTALASEFGDVAVRYRDMLKDGRITQREADAFHKEIMDVVRRGSVMAAHVQQLVGRPALAAVKK